METNSLVALVFAVTGLMDLALVYLMRERFSGAVKAMILGAAAVMFAIAWLLGTGRWRLA